MKLEAYVLPFNVKNINNYKYPIALKSQIIKQFKELTKDTGLFGEFPAGNNNSINLDHISHQIIDMKYDKDNQALKCTFEIYENTSTGQAVKQLLKAGFPVYAVIRGTGFISKRGIIKDYNLTTIDFNNNSTFENEFCRLSIIED